MAECCILHTGAGGATEVTTAWLRGGYHAVFGSSNGGETARFLLPLGALSIRARITRTATRAWDWWTNNNTHYFRTENTWHVEVTGWRRDSVLSALYGPVRLGSPLGAAPAALADWTLSLYMPLQEQLLSALADAEKGNEAYAIIQSQNVSQKYDGTTVIYEIPCPAGLLIEVPTGTEAVPAFTGGAAARLYLSSESRALRLTRDLSLFDGTMTTTTDLFVESGGSGFEEW